MACQPYWRLPESLDEARGGSARSGTPMPAKSVRARSPSAMIGARYGVVDGRHVYEVAIELIADGRAPVERLVTSRFALAQAPEAFRTAADKTTGSVKVHITAEGSG